MAGTCLETPEQKPRNEDEEPIVFSFYQDVHTQPDVMACTVMLANCATRSTASLTRYADSWRKNESLWKQDKHAVLDKFVQQSPSAVEVEERMAKYARMAADLWSSGKDKDCHFIRVSARPLIAAVRDEATAWIGAIGRAVGEADRLKLLALQSRLAERESALGKEPQDLEGLTAVLATIADVRAMGMGFELECLDLRERYRTRFLYDVPADEAESAAVHALLDQYGELLKRADDVDYNLWEVKARFAEETQKEADDFTSEVHDLRAALKDNGPGKPGMSLDAGADALNAFLGRFANAFKRREELARAQRLFSLPMNSYPELIEGEAELKRYTQLFDMYKVHTSAVQVFGDTLWADLELKRLTTHGEEIEAKLAAAQAIRDLPPFAVFEETIVAFRESLPLLEVLKGDALRKRHWDALGEITGLPIDTESNTFTLGKIFAMQLHKHAAEVADLCKAAAKELVIEGEIKKLAEAWKDTKFEMAKYNKGGDDRGMVLRGTEEVTVALEDAALNLQSMLASRYVKPFADEARRPGLRLFCPCPHPSQPSLSAPCQCPL